MFNFFKKKKAEPQPQPAVHEPKPNYSKLFQTVPNYSKLSQTFPNCLLTYYDLFCPMF